MLLGGPVGFYGMAAAKAGHARDGHIGRGRESDAVAQAGQAHQEQTPAPTIGNVTVWSEVKRAYDPDNVFRLNQNIVP